MSESYCRLLEEISKPSRAPVYTKLVLRTLANSVADRKFHKGEPMIDDKSSSFQLVYQLDMIDIARHVEHEIGIGNPTFFYLNEKAIKLHRDLCEEGYYGGKEDPIDYPEIDFR